MRWEYMIEVAKQHGHSAQSLHDLMCARTLEKLKAPEGKHLGAVIDDGDFIFVNGTDIVIPKEFQFPENCYQKLKKSDDIFDQMAAALVVLRLNDTGEPVPPQEVEFAHSIMDEQQRISIQQEQKGI